MSARTLQRVVPCTWFAAGALVTLLVVGNWNESSSDSGRVRPQHGSSSASNVRSPRTKTPVNSATGSANGAESGHSLTSQQEVSSPRYLSGTEPAARLYTDGGHDHDAWRHLDPTKLSPLTAMAQELLWKHQHPEDCSKAQFAVSSGHMKGNGIGSILHVSGFHLAAALEVGRVFMWSATAGEEWTDEHTCGSQRNWECHFRAPSSCTLADIRGAGSGRPEEGNWQGVELHHTAMGFESPRVPTVLDRALLKAFPGMKGYERKYWWRGQSVAYLMRFNAATVTAVRQLREDAALWSIKPINKTLTLAQAATIPFPPGVIHAHVRHGDKYTEMKLQGTERYLAAAEEMVHNQPTLLAPRTMFVSTEDPSVLSEAEAATERGWVVLYSSIKRSNTGPLAQVQNLGADRAGFTTRTHLLQLLLSLEAEAWIT